MAVLSADGTKILNNYDRFTGETFNATKYATLPAGITVDNAIWFKNKTAFGGGFAKRDFEGRINAKWFGAIGDGSDQSVYIQKAVDSTPEGSALYIPTGNYYLQGITVTKSITIIGEENCNIYGVKTFVGFDPVKTIITAITSGKEITISGVNFFGETHTPGIYSPSQGMGSVILFKNLKSWTIKNCSLNGFTLRPGTSALQKEFHLREHAIITALNCDSNNYINNKHLGNGYIEQVWVAPSDGGTYNITDNYVAENLITPTGTAVWSLTPFTVIHGKGIFSRNEIHDCYQSAANLLVYDSTIENNIIDNVVNSVGIDLTESGYYAGDNNVVRYNTITNTKQYGINAGGSNTDISYNVMTNNRSGVYFRSKWDATYQQYGEYNNWKPRTFKNLSLSGNIISLSKEESIFIQCVNDGADATTKYNQQFEGVTIEKNNLSDSIFEAIHLDNLRNVKITNSNIFKNWGANHSSISTAICLFGYIDSLRIEGNIFDNTVFARIATTFASVLGFNDITVRDNKSKQTVGMNVSYSTGQLVIENNEKMAVADVVVTGRPLRGFNYKDSVSPSIYQSNGLPVLGYGYKGDFIINSSKALLLPLGWNVTQEGGLTSGNIVRSTTPFLRNYTYSDGSVWEVIVRGLVSATEPATVLTANVGDTLTDGAATIRKVATQVAILQENASYVADTGLPETTIGNAIAGTGIYLNKSGGEGNTLFLKSIVGAGTWKPIQGIVSGTTSQRPAGVLPRNYKCFDTSLGREIASDGLGGWVATVNDATTAVKGIVNKAVNVTDISTADATDLPTAVALANANKAKMNALLASLRTAGLM